MNTGKICGSFLSKPIVGIPSGRLNGQMQANKVDNERANPAAISKIGDGLEIQNQSSPARAEKSVKKSETATLRKMDVVIWP